MYMHIVVMDKSNPQLLGCGPLRLHTCIYLPVELSLGAYAGYSSTTENKHTVVYGPLGVGGRGGGIHLPPPRQPPCPRIASQTEVQLEWATVVDTAVIGNKESNTTHSLAWLDPSLSSLRDINVQCAHCMTQLTERDGSRHARLYHRRPCHSISET